MNKTDELYQISQIGREVQELKRGHAELVKANEMQWDAIQGHIQKNTEASNRQTTALEHIAGSIDSHLEQWKTAIPMEQWRQAVPTRLVYILMGLSAGGGFIGGVIKEWPLP